MVPRNCGGVSFVIGFVRPLLLLFPLILSAQPRDGSILERSACKLKEPADPRYICEKLTYASDGLPVVAYLYQSSEAAGRPRPVVVFNRPSYVVKDQLPVLIPIFNRLVDGGFVVVAPMYRGSEGAPGRDEMGGADLHDLMNVVPLVKELPGVDGSNLFLYGHSRGGIMCLLALRDGFPARAAATVGAITDIGAYLEHDSRARELAKMIWPDFVETRDAILASRSAQQWPEKLKKPVFLMHGGADPQVDPTHSLKLALRLQELGREYAISIFAGGNHGVTQVAPERDRQVLEWFRKHLRPVASF